MDTEYLTPPQVAQRLRVKATTIRRWIATGMLEAETFREGKRNRYLIKRSTIDAIERRASEHHRKLV